MCVLRADDKRRPRKPSESQLTREEGDEIRRAHFVDGATYRALATKYNTTPPTIATVVKDTVRYYKGENPSRRYKEE